jgi:uncharacterized delta-60 repeat protein
VRHPAVTTISLSIAIFVCSLAVSPHVAAQIAVTSAVPNSTTQGTTNLDVVVHGNGFKKGAKVHWFVTGTTNPGGVTVNSTTFNNSGQLTANITVAADAVVSGFDIQVMNTDGRTGKGTELFAVNASGNNKTSCSVPQPMNPPEASVACSASSGYTCLDATFGSAGQIPPGGLVLTNTDGSVPGTSDLDVAAAVRQQSQSDGSLKYLAIGTTSQPVGTSYVNGAALIRYNLDGSLDASFGSGGIAKYFPPSNGSLSLTDGGIDSAGRILALGNYQSGGSMFLLRFTPSGVLDLTFNSVGYVSFTNFKASSMTLQSDGKILVGGQLFGAKRSAPGLVIRLNGDGTFDNSFGTNGQVALTTFNVLTSVALQSVGSQLYILAGGSSLSTPESFMVARLTNTGAVDSTFGVSGTAVASFCGSRSRISSLSVDRTGNILAFGWNNLANLVFAVARFTGSGGLDSSFGDPGTPGQTTLDFYGSTNYVTSIQPVLDSLGNQTGFIVAAAVYQSTGASTSNQFWGLAKYRNNGSLDTTFGTNGVFAIDFGSKNNSVLLPSPSDLLVQADGKIVMAGTSKFSSGPFAGYNFAMARLWP